jgi:L-ribulokinase
MSGSRGPRFAIGVDYGTNSVRALIVEVDSGREIATHVYEYPSGQAGILLDPHDPNLARQNPADYIAGALVSIGSAVKKARRQRGFAPDRVAGIGVDTTGSTPLPVDRHGIPLALQPRFRKNPAAQAWLWKDHTAHEEAAAITATAIRAGVPYLDKCGGVYSSEWFWSKIWHCRRTAPAVFNAAFSWVECCDFIPAYLTGNLDPLRMKRSICAAGHKAMFNDAWGGLPSAKFLAKLAPALAALRDRLYRQAETSDQVAGFLIPEVACQVGLPAGIPVAVGGFDAHLGAVGAGIKPGTLVKIIGTSTRDLMVAPAAAAVADVPGVCGIVPGSIIPGMDGIEAGQSAVGDIFNWFVTRLCPPEYTRGDPHANLSRAAAKLRPGQSGLLALDWNNGNRTILVDPRLTGLLIGQTLQTSAPEIYRALIEGTAFGALTIIRRLEEYGVKVKEVVNCGGIAEKNPLLMQIYADVLNRPMKISAHRQTCALGAAIFGALVGGAVKDLKTAQQKMTRTRAGVFKPDPSSAKTYSRLFALYSKLHDAFGTTKYHGELGRLMKELIAIRDQSRQA